MDKDPKPPILEYATPEKPPEKPDAPLWAYILPFLALFAPCLAGVGADSTSFPFLKKSLFTGGELLVIVLLAKAGRLQIGCVTIAAILIMLEVCVMWFQN